MLIPIKCGSSTIINQYWIYDSEDHILIVEYKNKKTKIYTCKDYYNKLSIGDVWNKTGNCNYTDSNNNKKKK